MVVIVYKVHYIHDVLNLLLYLLDRVMHDLADVHDGVKYHGVISNIGLMSACT